MALTDCKECGKQISSEALACPNCGIPMRSGSHQARPAITRPNFQSDREPEQTCWQGRPTLWKYGWLWWIMYLSIVACLISFCEGQLVAALAWLFVPNLLALAFALIARSQCTYKVTNRRVIAESKVFGETTELLLRDIRSVAVRRVGVLGVGDLIIGSGASGKRNEHGGITESGSVVFERISSVKKVSELIQKLRL